MHLSPPKDRRGYQRVTSHPQGIALNRTHKSCSGLSLGSDVPNVDMAESHSHYHDDDDWMQFRARWKNAPGLGCSLEPDGVAQGLNHHTYDKNPQPPTSGWVCLPPDLGHPRAHPFQDGPPLCKM